jgi:hypothetical protein
MNEFPHGAEKVTKDLDLLVEMDEPEQLVRELAARAGIQGTTRGKRHDMWEIVVKHALACSRELEEKNQPSSKRATDEASPD